MAAQSAHALEMAQWLETQPQVARGRQQGARLDQILT
jgi:hypothetical protein